MSDNLFWQNEFLNNTYVEWLWALLVLIGALIVLRIFKTVAISRLKAITLKTKTKIDDLVIDGINAVHWPFYVFASIYFSAQFIELHEAVKRWLFYVFLAAVVYYAIRFAERAVDFAAKRVMEKREKSNEQAGAVKFMSTLAKAVLWAGAVVMLLSNMGYNVNSLIAGLGIGGIAVALAIQNILGDLFSSLAIYLDKPFKIGDFVVIGEHTGIVKRVGIKTTRIQALQGEELVISNNELTSTRIQNFGVMRRRRIVFSLGVTYETPRQKMQAIPDIIKEILEKEENIEPDRVHFKSFGDFSLNIEVVYYINSGDYKEYMDRQQNINLAIMERFEKEGIEFAYPTQTLYLNKKL